MTSAAAGIRTIALVLATLCVGTNLGAEVRITPIYTPRIPAIVSPGVNSEAAPLFRYATDGLWQYLRKGLSYLESPDPLSEPEAVPPAYVHPDGRGFGCYGFSPEAYQDVQRLYPYFRRYSWANILGSPRLYDLANRAFCDWLLKNLRDYVSLSQDPSEVFDAVQKAWNLGLGGFKKGRIVVLSRTRRAEEFKAGILL
ncbi:MAG: hypothetical protein WCY10_04405 [Candidatus Omnitrophota bacterium]